MEIRRIALNKELQKAKKNKTDEFYTQLTDIEKEMLYDKPYFKDNVILCTYDNPYESNIFVYFANVFHLFRFKKLIATCYDGSPIVGKQLLLFDFEPEENKTTKCPHKIIMKDQTYEEQDSATGIKDVELILRNKKNILTLLKGNGDIRTQECIELVKEANIVLTNLLFFYEDI